MLADRDITSTLSSVAAELREASASSLAASCNREGKLVGPHINHGTGQYAKFSSEFIPNLHILV